MFKKNIIVLLSFFFTLLCLTACSKNEKIVFAIPNDSTNKARALLLMQQNGLIRLKTTAGITADLTDITNNFHQLAFREVPASQVPEILPEVDFAVINYNYAVDAENINPVKDALALEDSFSYYSNIIAVKKGTEKEPLLRALLAAVQSQQVVDYINKTYSGALVSTVINPTDGYCDDLDYEKLSGQKITIAASPVPHAQILREAAKILSAKNIQLVILEYDDYNEPNILVNNGTIMANYMQHLPYLLDFNLKNNTELVSAGTIHVEPMGIYGGKSKSLDIFKRNTRILRDDN